MADEPELAIVGELLATAQSASKAHQMLAEAKTARQTDGGGPYDWMSPEQTVEGRAAAIIKEMAETLERIKSITMRGDISLGGRVAFIQSIAHTALLSRAGANNDPSK